MEDDKKVKDSTVPDKAPEKQKDLKKPSGKSATGKPLDGIDINPQLNDVSTDGNQLKIRKEDSVDLTVPVIQERKALTLPQRQKRGRQLRARENSMARAREVAKSRLAPSGKIEQRALSHARAIIKKRFAARKGTPYAELTTTEKIQVDTAVAKKTKLIQKMAKRLLPRIRKAEYERLKSFRTGAALQDLSTQNPKSQGIMPKVSEEMSQLFYTLDSSDTNALIGIIENTINQFKQNNNPLGDQLKRMLNAVLPEDVVTESLMKKSDKTGIAFSTLREVFDRGEYSWDASNRMTQEQYAFARVNSYIAKGKAWHMDADLREVKVVNTKLDESFSGFMENYNYHVGLSSSTAKKREAHWKKMQKYSDKDQRAYQDAPGDKAARKKGMPQSEYTKKYHAMYGEEVDELNQKFAQESIATEKRKKIELVDRPPADQAVKARQAEIQKKIIDESDKPANREIGTDSLVKKYKKDTPGQKSNLDESFKTVWDAGIGVTLSAADCGIKIKGGFALHPDVIDQMQTDEFDEEVRSADIEGVVVHTADGKTVVRRQKRNRKIIGTGNLTDGKPDDTI